MRYSQVSPHQTKILSHFDTSTNYDYNAFQIFQDYNLSLFISFISEKGCPIWNPPGQGVLNLAYLLSSRMVEWHPIHKYPWLIWLGSGWYHGEQEGTLTSSPSKYAHLSCLYFSRVIWLTCICVFLFDNDYSFLGKLRQGSVMCRLSTVGSFKQKQKKSIQSKQYPLARVTGQHMRPRIKKGT